MDKVNKDICDTERSGRVREGGAGGGRRDTMQISQVANVRGHRLVGLIEVVCT